jgi:hypothetical protein
MIDAVLLTALCVALLIALVADIAMVAAWLGRRRR